MKPKVDTENDPAGVRLLKKGRRGLWRALFSRAGLITLFLLPRYNGDFLTAFRYASFQVATITSTTGFATTDFNLWPVTVRMLILVLMFFGSCVGSTAGGMKLQRVVILCKAGAREIRKSFMPKSAKPVRFEGQVQDDGVVQSVVMFAMLYVMLAFLGGFLVSLEGKYDVETNLTAALTCVSNVGPGLGAVVGPAGNFAGYGPFAKIVLSVLMLAGRLEILPVLALFHRDIWRRA